METAPRPAEPPPPLPAPAPPDADEIARLAAVGVDADDVAALHAEVSQLIEGESGRLADGTRVRLYTLLVALPATLISAGSAIVGTDGRALGGGLAAALPIPPRVRFLVRRDALPPEFRRPPKRDTDDPCEATDGPVRDTDPADCTGPGDDDPWGSEAT